MNKQAKRLTGILMGSAVLFFTSCLEKDEFPPEPAISFVSFSQYPDSAIVSFSFTDGDGNLGLDQEDTTGVFDDCYRAYNIYCEYYELQNGIWVHIPRDPCNDQVPFYYRVPWVKPEGQIKSQRGQIDLKMEPSYYLTSNFDTCKFLIHVADRDFNESNIIETSVFIKP